MNAKIKLNIFNVLLTLTVALTGTYIALEHVPLVTMITVFAGAFGAGASLVGLIISLKEERKKRKLS
ncbi:MAG: hypothetical protein KY428_12290 [Bacteroidetes bacterium]|nr:hypothetical protein [Bacteroidota bacterium]